jgi:hypothetical protein
MAMAKPRLISCVSALSGEIAIYSIDIFANLVLLIDEDIV